MKGRWKGGKGRERRLSEKRKMEKISQCRREEGRKGEGRAEQERWKDQKREREMERESWTWQCLIFVANTPDSHQLWLPPSVAALVTDLHRWFYLGVSHGTTFEPWGYNCQKERGELFFLSFFFFFLFSLVHSSSKSRRHQFASKPCSI